MTTDMQTGDQASKDWRAVRGVLGGALTVVERSGRVVGVWVLAGAVFYLGAQVADVARAVWSIETSPSLVQAVDGVSKAVRDADASPAPAPPRDYLGRDPVAAAIAAQTDAIREEARRERQQRDAAAFGR